MPIHSQKSNLEEIANFVLNVAKEIIRAHSNVEPLTFTKNLLLDLSRRKVPDSIKKSVKDKEITFDLSDTVEIRRLYKVTETYPLKCSFKKTDTKEYTENRAKNVSYFSVGNCGESARICAAIWMECTRKVLALFNLAPFPPESAPYIECVGFKKINDKLIEDHSFAIVNRPAHSDILNVEDWIKDNNEVVILDLWKRSFSPISVNKELQLPEEERCLTFRSLCENLKQGGVLEVKFRAQLGEGHSNRWLEKGRSSYYLLEQKYPNMFASTKQNFENTFFKQQRKTNDKKHFRRVHPYKL